MSHLSPTRVSVYDFLYQDTQPIVPLLADATQLSLPQARQGLTLCLQSFCFGLIKVHQALDADTVHKRLLQRANIKTLRQYNAMNLHTMQQVSLNVQGMATLLFHGANTASVISDDIAKRLATKPHQAEILLDLVIGLALRELSIIVDYAQLNSDEIAQWLSLQPQFLQAKRFAMTDEKKTNVEKTSPTVTTQIEQSDQLTQQSSSDNATPPSIDVKHWQTLLAMILPTPPTPTDNTHTDGSVSNATNNLITNTNNNTNHGNTDKGLPSYAKAIGRTQTPKALTTTSTAKSAALTNMPTTTNQPPLVTQFTSMTGIHLPYRRWLLQLAQVTDVYLSRQRLKINEEPNISHSRPLVNFGFLQENRPLTTNETPFEFDEPAPFYKNPVILLIVAVIGGLLLLTVLKYHHQQPAHQPSAPTTPTIAPSQDVVILRVNEDDTPEPPSDPKVDKQTVNNQTKETKNNK